MYTYIPKPTLGSYTNLNPQGKEQYDQASLTYDDANTFYDGTNMSQYTKVPKATAQGYTYIPKPT